jgi:hypothetical protein
VVTKLAFATELIYERQYERVRKNRS